MNLDLIYMLVMNSMIGIVCYVILTRMGWSGWKKLGMVVMAIFPSITVKLFLLVMVAFLPWPRDKDEDESSKLSATESFTAHPEHKEIIT